MLKLVMYVPAFKRVALEHVRRVSRLLSMGGGSPPRPSLKLLTRCFSRFGEKKGCSILGENSRKRLATNIVLWEN